MKKYEVYVKTPNKFLNVKNKMVRTPIKFTCYESELDKYRSIFHISGIDNFEINDANSEQINKPKTIDKIENTQNQPVIKESPVVVESVVEEKIEDAITEEIVEEIEEANTPKRGRKKKSTLDELSE